MSFFIKAKVVLNRVITLIKATIRIRTFLGFSGVITSLTKIRNALDVMEEFAEAVMALVDVIKYVYAYVAHRARNWGRRWRQWWWVLTLSCDLREWLLTMFVGIE